MYIDFLIERFEQYIGEVALIRNGQTTTYEALKARYDYWLKFLNDNKVHNMVVSVQGEFNADTIGLMLAIIENSNIYVPLANSVKKKERFYEIAQVQVTIDVETQKIIKVNLNVSHPILKTIIEERKHPGLILFSSGTTGEPKAAVHDLVPMLKKYHSKGKKISSIAFLLFDHIGGFNTVMYSISNGGKIVTIENRSTEEVCKAIEQQQIEILPTSPSFINMILYSKAYIDYDLSSLKTVTYGTEPMPLATLKAFHEIFPNVTLKQTYGLSELGIMRTKSEGSDSLWMKLGDDEHQIEIREGILWIKTEMAMLGYLNAESPFDENGWFNTKDSVEVKGEYIKILGRISELINVGGEKVYPAEVESVLLNIPGIEDAIVFGEDNALLGKVVACSVSISQNIDQGEMKKLIKKNCRNHLEKYKCPINISFNDKNFVTERFKRKR